MYFRYDGDTPIGFEFNGKEYYYVTNLQGDVIAILDASGNLVAEYSYDAWGNCTIEKDTNTIAYINPLRYRGYYYDSDTDMYYLQSRYYDANIGRFINADSAEMTLNDVFNLFAYCENNPVMFCDYSGYKWITKLSEYNKRWYSRKKIYKRIKENYNKNKKLFKNYYKLAIYGQATSPVKSMRYGDYNISYNGCELVAVYNVMRFINKGQSFPQIILEFEINHMYYFFNSGKYGTDPEDLKKYFKAHNVNFGYATRLDIFYKNIIAKKNKCGIFSFWNNKWKEHPFDYVSGGLHTVAYKYDSKTKKIKTYNLYNSDTKVRFFTINQLKSYIAEHNFIIGYWF